MIERRSYHMVSQLSSSALSSASAVCAMRAATCCKSVSGMMSTGRHAVVGMLTEVSGMPPEPPEPPLPPEPPPAPPDPPPAPPEPPGGCPPEPPLPLGGDSTDPEHANRKSTVQSTRLMHRA